MRLPRVAQLFLNIIFPARCVGCTERLDPQSPHQVICGVCFDRIELATGFTCPDCGRRRHQAQSVCHPKSHFTLGAAAPYANPAVRGLIYALKYSRAKAAAKPLGAMMGRYLLESAGLGNLPLDAYSLLPMPLHHSRERERGFNHAFAIAQGLQDYLATSGHALPIERGVLLRVRPTRSQVKLENDEERTRNVAGAFSAPSPSLAQGRRFIVVDDVFTSGATARAAVAALHTAGARGLLVLTAARARDW